MPCQQDESGSLSKLEHVYSLWTQLSVEQNSAFINRSICMGDFVKNFSNWGSEELTEGMSPVKLML